MKLKNKKAYFDFDIEQEYVCGIKLVGSEVKSVRMKMISFSDSYVLIDNENQVILRNLSIAKYENASFDNHDEKRDRILLLNKKEIEKISHSQMAKNLSIIPLEIFTKGTLIKVKIGLGRGKKKYDKRNSIKEKDIEREVKRNEKN